jgi:hypothetical protein
MRLLGFLNTAFSLLALLFRNSEVFYFFLFFSQIGLVNLVREQLRMPFGFLALGKSVRSCEYNSATLDYSYRWLHYEKSF